MAAIEVRLRTVEGNEDGDKTPTRTIVEGDYTLEQAKQVAADIFGSDWEVRGASFVDQQFVDQPDEAADELEQQRRRLERAAERAAENPTDTPPVDEEQ